jgi:hypothetical protein
LNKITKYINSNTDQEPYNYRQQQGYKQEDDMKGFGVMNPPNFSKDEVFVKQG